VKGPVAGAAGKVRGGNRPS